MKAKVIKQNVGNDISKDDFKVCFYQLLETQNKRIKGTRTFKNTLTGFTKFLKWVEKSRAKDVEVRITLEATGVYYEQLVYFLNDNSDYYVSVVLPNMSKAYFKSLNVKSKTDAIDAKVLGQMGLERDLNKWSPATSNLRILKQLTRDRSSLVEQKTVIANRLHALNHSYQPHKTAVKHLNQQASLVKKQIKESEKQIVELIKADDVLNEKVENICSIKGLSITTVACVIAETGGFELFTSRGQLISYAGYDIVQNESGSSIKGPTRISKRGNKHIRRALHFPAIVAVKYNPELKRIYDRIFEKCFIKMKAYVPIQRKLLVLIYTLYKKNEKYDSTINNPKEDEKEDQNSDQKNDNTKELEEKDCRQDVMPAYCG